MPNNELNGTLGDHPEWESLSYSELTKLPGESLVDIIMGQRHVIDTLNDRLAQRETEIIELTDMASYLAVDPETGILTAAALDVLGEVLFSTKILEILRERGYLLEMCFLDIDDLKTHNLFGGYAGGDAALFEVAKRLKMLYRRKSDVLSFGVLDFLKTQHRTRQDDGLTDGIRFERGDEIIAWRYAPPQEEDVRRNGWDPEREVTRISKGFEGASVSYAVRESLTPQDIKALDPRGQFKIESGIVTAPVSITFACLRTPIPVNRRQAVRITHKADDLISAHKSRRASAGSAGIALIMTTEDLR